MFAYVCTRGRTFMNIFLILISIAAISSLNTALLGAKGFGMFVAKHQNLSIIEHELRRIEASLQDTPFSLMNLDTPFAKLLIQDSSQNRELAVALLIAKLKQQMNKASLLGLISKASVIEYSGFQSVKVESQNIEILIFRISVSAESAQVTKYLQSQYLILPLEYRTSLSAKQKAQLKLGRISWLEFD